jgi:RNA polymerase sigma-70 factor (ECF subfamily)
MVDCETTPVVVPAQISDNRDQSAHGNVSGVAFAMNEREKVLEEADFVERSRRGDARAMEAIYERFKRPLFNLAFRFTYNSTVAEDLLQDIFIKVFTHLDDVQNVETFSGWIYRIGLNTCYSYLRGKKVEAQKSIPLSEIEGKIEEACYDTQEKEMKKPLDEAIQSLPEKLKAIFLLHDVQGFKHEEIAKTLGCSVGTSKSQLFKARMRIRQFLKEKQVL